MITTWNVLALIFYLACYSSASSVKFYKVLLLLAVFTGMLLTLLSFAKLLFQLLLHSAFPFSLPCNAARASQECPNTSWIRVFSENFCPLFANSGEVSVSAWSARSKLIWEKIDGKSNFLFNQLIAILRKIVSLLTFPKMIMEIETALKLP